MNRIDAGGMVAGVLFMLIGGMFLLARLDLLVLRPDLLLPVVLLGGGAAMIAAALLRREHEERD